MLAGAQRALVALRYDKTIAAAFVAQAQGNTSAPIWAVFQISDQVFYWRKAQAPKNLKGRSARLYERWRGVAIIIGREWDNEKETSAYWVLHGGDLYLVSQQHLRYATAEERFSQETCAEPPCLE